LESWDFDGDELVFLLVASAVALGGAWRWYVRLWQTVGFRRSTEIRWALSAAPAVGLLPVSIVLSRWADRREVVGHADDQVLFLAGGAVWLWGTAAATSVFGISPIDDAIERANPAAACAVCGALWGSMAIYSGANVGSGATIWTTLVPALVATSVWLVLWALVEAISSVSESIAVERDLAGGIRHGGWLLASGVVLGRSVAGDFVSWEGTFADMGRTAWPAIPLAMGAVALHLRLRPTPAVPHPKLISAGILPAVFFVALAGGYLVELGSIDQRPRDLASFTR
jgi:hypothetical protein